MMASREAIAEVKREENVDLSGTSSPEIGHDTVRKELPKRNKGPPKPKGRDRERSKSLVRARVTRTTAQVSETEGDLPHSRPPLCNRNH